MGKIEDASVHPVYYSDEDSDKDSDEGRQDDGEGGEEAAQGVSNV